MLYLQAEVIKFGALFEILFEANGHNRVLRDIYQSLVGK
jgi:hypothetical protein